MKTKTRYAIVMLFCVLINQLFYTIAAELQLPIWLDVTGTALAALILEPTAGILVGLINNFYLAVFIFDSSSMLYFVVSAMVAVVVGTLMKKNGKLQLKNIPLTFVLVVILSAVLSTLLTLWRNKGVPDEIWEIYYFQQAKSAGIPVPLACLWANFIVKLYDTIATGILVAFFYFITPKKFK